MRKLIKGSKLLSLIFAFLYFTHWTAISFASEINNFASISYKIGGTPQEISTNLASTTINAPSGGTIIAPHDSSQTSQYFTVFGFAHSQIDIKVDGLIVASTTSDVNGYYAVEVSLLPGMHTLTVMDDGVEGETINIEILTSPLPLDFPRISSPANGSKIQNRRPAITGKATPNAPVTVYNKHNTIEIVGIGTSDSNGNFSIIPNQDLPSGTNQIFVMDTSFNFASRICEVTFTDPEGVVFDSITNNPIQGAQVILYNANTDQPCMPGVEIANGDSNPSTTGADGRYLFNAVNGNYYLRVRASGYTFPSALSGFPRSIATGSRGERLTVAGVLLTINLPMDAKNSLLKIEKDANKKEVTVGDIVTYTVIIKNETAGNITNVYIEDKIPPGFKYISGKAILDNVMISDPTGARPLTFNIGTVNAGTSRVLKYQLVAGSGVTFGNYENSAFAKYSNGAAISNTAAETVKVVPDPLFDLGTVIGKVFNDSNENGIQDAGEEPIPYARIAAEEGTIVTADKYGRWHLPALPPGRHLFRIDESSLPEGAHPTTEKVVIVDITNGILNKVNFGVKVQRQEEKIEEKTELKSNLDNAASSPVYGGKENDEVTGGKAEPIDGKQIKGREDYLFFVVLGDLKAGYTFNKGNIEPVRRDDKFKEGLWKEGKLAYYLKGKIKGKYVITSSLDTDRKRKEIFRVVDPKKYYPVYGDASSINYEASDTQGQLYCLIEWDKSKAIWGNYYTEFNETEYAKFNRALYGGKVYYESVSGTKFGRSNTKLILFDAKAKQLASHNEFVGTGGSLYYLKHRDIIEGTDSVKIEVRDKISGLVLAAIVQRSGVDYHLDYSQGRILFWRPVSSIAESSSIISTYLLDGNPVYVVVDYEYEPKDKYYEGTYGLRGSQSLTDYLQLGITYVKEAKPKQDYELKGADAALQITKDTIIKIEYAESESEQLNNFVSTDGGMSFTGILTDKNTSGRAYGIKGQTKLWDKVNINSYYSYTGKNFSSLNSVSQQGTKKYGLWANWNITNNTIFSLREDIQELVNSGNLQTQNQIGADYTRTTTAQISHTQERLTLTGEYRHQGAKSQLTNIEDQTNQDADIVAAKAGYKVSRNIEASLEHQETVKGSKDRQTTGGLTYNLTEWLKLKAAQTVGRKGAATTAGAHAQSSDGKTEAFVDRTQGYNSAQSNNTSVSAGLKSQLDEKREIFGTLTLSEDSLEGKKQTTSFGGAQKINDKMKISASRDIAATKDSTASTDVLGVSGDVNDRLSADVAFEKGDVNNLDGSRANRRAGSIRLTYVETDNLKASGKLELRDDKGDEDKRQYLIYSDIEYLLNKGATLFANLNVSETRNATANITEAEFNEVTLGVALRPIAWDRLNLIGKCTYFENEQPQGQNAFTDITAEKASVFALEGIYEFTDKLQFMGKIACKWGEERVSGFDFTDSQTWLLINRLNYKFGEYWGLSGEYRLLNQRQADDINQGSLFEINRDLGDFVQVGLGYNFTNFSDDLVHSNDYSAHGPYIRVTSKLFDRTPEEAARIKKKREERKKKSDIGKRTKKKPATAKTAKKINKK